MRKILLITIAFLLFGCGAPSDGKEVLNIQLKEHKAIQNDTIKSEKNRDKLDKALEDLKKNTPKKLTKEEQRDFDALLNEPVNEDAVIEYGKGEQDLDFKKPQTGMKILATVDGLDFNLEVAQTQEEREHGLMFRETLDPDGGMVFIFEKSGAYAFWMKNTLIPLDIIWLDEQKKVIDFIVAQPCKKDPCPQFTPAAKAKYVVEIPAGNFTGEIGDFVSF